jgi:hypothetical protein
MRSLLSVKNLVISVEESIFNYGEYKANKRLFLAEFSLKVFSVMTIIKIIRNNANISDTKMKK